MSVLWSSSFRLPSRHIHVIILIETRLRYKDHAPMFILLCDSSHNNCLYYYRWLWRDSCIADIFTWKLYSCWTLQHSCRTLIRNFSTLSKHVVIYKLYIFLIYDTYHTLLWHVPYLSYNFLFSLYYFNIYLASCINQRLKWKNVLKSWF